MNRRCYLPPRDWGKGEVGITGREAHHLAHVLRVKPGAVLTCFDGEGHEAEGIVCRVTRRELFLKLKAKREIPPPPWQLSLGVAIPKGSRLDPIVDQATQLGVSQILPLLTCRGVIQSEVRLPRLVQIAIEAARQSGLSRLPVIHPATPWSHCVRSFGGYDRVLMATVQGPHEDLNRLLRDPLLSNLLVLIGPEGDFTPEEIREAEEAGAHRISLGPTVLRVETAAIAAVSVLSFLLRKFFLRSP